MDKLFADFFGANEGPFKRTPDTEYYFLSEKHKDALNKLENLINTEESFFILTGLPGTGKSLTLKKFTGDLPANVVYTYIFFPNLTPEELLKTILESLGIDVEINATKSSLYLKFQNLISILKEEEKRLLILVDEAQSTPAEALEELWRLSHIDTDKTINVAIAGQPELLAHLNTEEFAQIKQNIKLTAELTNLDMHECLDYINYRLEKAGSDLVIKNNMSKVVWKFTKGNPRTINKLMERVVISAYMDGAKRIKKSHMISGLHSLNITYSGNKVKFIAIFAAFAMCAVFAMNFNKIKSKIFDKPVIVTVNNPMDNDTVVVTDNTSNFQDNISVDNGTVEPIDNITVPVVQSEFIAQAIVNIRYLNVRAEKSTSAEKVAILVNGQSVNVYTETDEWLEIELPNGGKGWIYRPYVTVIYN